MNIQPVKMLSFEGKLTRQTYPTRNGIKEHPYDKFKQKRSAWLAKSN